MTCWLRKTNVEGFPRVRHFLFFCFLIYEGRADFFFFAIRPTRTQYLTLTDCTGAIAGVKGRDDFIG